MPSFRYQARQLAQQKRLDGNVNYRRNGILFLVAVLIAGGVVLVPNLLRRFRCTEPVTATVLEGATHERRGRRGRRYTVTDHIFSYQYEGEYYSDVYETLASEQMPEIGSRIEIYINPENPAEYFNRGSRDKALIAGTCLLIIFGAAAVSQIWIPNHKYGQ